MSFRPYYGHDLNDKGELEEWQYELFIEKKIFVFSYSGSPKYVDQEETKDERRESF